MPLSMARNVDSRTNLSEVGSVILNSGERNQHAPSKHANHIIGPQKSAGANIFVSMERNPARKNKIISEYSVPGMVSNSISRFQFQCLTGSRWVSSQIWNRTN